MMNYEIVDYVLEIDTQGQHRKINIGLADGSNWDILPHSFAHFAALVVVLQNEKPLFFDLNSGLVYSGPEPTGGTVDPSENA